MRFARLDKELTRQAHFLDRRSKVGLRFDGSMRIVLKGRDKEILRAACFERDNYACVDRGDGHICYGPLQMSHWPPLSKSEGSDVLSGVATRCWRAHVLLDGHKQPMHF